MFTFYEGQNNSLFNNVTGSISIRIYFYRPPTKFGEGNVFISVCLFTKEEGMHPWYQVLSRGISVCLFTKEESMYPWYQVLSRGRGLGMPVPRSLPGVGVCAGDGYVKGDGYLKG